MIEEWPLWAALGVMAVVVIAAFAAAHDHEKPEQLPRSSFDL